MGRYSMAMYGDDLGAFKMTADDLKNSLMSAGSGGLGILATSWLLGKLPPDMVADPANNSRIKSLVGVAIGVLGGRVIDSYGSRDAAMGFTGAVAGASVASLLASWMPETFPSVSLSGGGLSDYDMSALEATVATNSAAWRAPGLSAPDVATQTLRGFRGTETSDETIASFALLDNQGAPPPSF